MLMFTLILDFFTSQKPISNLLHDERFSRMFTDAGYQVDILSEEYRLLNPVISKMEKRLEEKQDDDEVTYLRHRVSTLRA